MKDDNNLQLVVPKMAVRSSEETNARQDGTDTGTNCINHSYLLLHFNISSTGLCLCIFLIVRWMVALHQSVEFETKPDRKGKRGRRIKKNQRGKGGSFPFNH